MCYYTLFLRELNIPIYYVLYDGTSCYGEVYSLLYSEEIDKIIKKPLSEEFNEEFFEKLMKSAEKKYGIPLSDIDRMFKQNIVSYDNHYIV